MSKSIFTIVILLCAHLVNGQINAITDTGDPVLLYQDGTWQYLNDSLIEDIEIPVNEKAFIKSDNSTFLIKSNRLNIGIWMNPKTWNFKKGDEGGATEFNFQNKAGDLYGMLISEKIQIPLETLKTIALSNARSAAPDIKIINEEYRTVNGLKVLMLQMAGTIQGLKFTYYGYYFSNANGTIQLLTYTSSDLFNKTLEEVELFLNGLVEI
jgi:hypothetical protein